MSPLWIILYWLHSWLVVSAFLLENTFYEVCTICFIRPSPKCILARRYYVSTALGGLYSYGCNCICTRLSASTSTIGFPFIQL
jgi:hypothetical protein